MKSTLNPKRASRQLMESFFKWFLVVFAAGVAPGFSFAGDPTGTAITFSQAAVDRPQGDFETLVIPLKRAQNLLLVEAKVDSIEGNFILDTGAPYLVLNKTYFRKGKEADGMRSEGVTGQGGTVFHTTIDRLQIDELYFESLKADLVNLGHIEDEKGIKILGLLGTSLFSDMEMEIDVAHNVLYLHKVDKNGKRLSAMAVDSSAGPGMQVPIVLENNVIFLNGTIGGSKLRFCLDTGAELNVLSNGVSKKVLQRFQLRSMNTLSGSSNRKVSVLGGEIDELVVGNHSFTRMQAILTGLEGLQSAYNTSIDGILGYNFLAEGRVIINFKQKQLTMYFYNDQVR